MKLRLVSDLKKHACHPDHIDLMICLSGSLERNTGWTLYLYPSYGVNINMLILLI